MSSQFAHRKFKKHVVILKVKFY